ncbi:MAG: hypothetical protein LBU11_12020 [Zoogloeaceae bacterium]|jgi:hypothetical protein|nr:hypothetical protein [Zoogloeaceae bacterium]
MIAAHLYAAQQATHLQQHYHHRGVPGQVRHESKKMTDLEEDIGPYRVSTAITKFASAFGGSTREQRFQNFQSFVIEKPIPV